MILWKGILKLDRSIHPLLTRHRSILCNTIQVEQSEEQRDITKGLHRANEAQLKIGLCHLWDLDKHLCTALLGATQYLLLTTMYLFSYRATTSDVQDVYCLWIMVKTHLWQRPSCDILHTTLKTKGEKGREEPKCTHFIPLHSLKISHYHMGSCFAGLWISIKDFVSSVLRTFHHFFLLAWKCNLKYFTREKLRCLKNNFTLCQHLHLKSASIPIQFWLPQRNIHFHQESSLLTYVHLLHRAEERVGNSLLLESISSGVCPYFSNSLCTP